MEGFQMKKMLFSIFWMLLIVTTFCLPYTSAQDYARWGLPEGAIVRLGKGYIKEMQYSPDGSILAITNSVGIWLYDATTLKELALLDEDSDYYYGMSFSPDGLILASGSYNAITLWDVTTRKQKMKFSNSLGGSSSILFSPDGIDTR